MNAQRRNVPRLLILIKDLFSGLPHGVNMDRVCEELQALVTALIFSLALTLAFGSAAFASMPDMSAGQHETASGHHESSPHDACVQELCSDHTTDCIPGVAHCSGSGGTAFVAPVEAPGLVHSGRQTWTLEGTRCLSGVDPLVARHPPRDLA